VSIHYKDGQITLYFGDALNVAYTLEDGLADCIVTSPPYFGLRDYGIDGQYGLEASPAAYVETMRALFSELRRVLACDGTLWLNIGDSYQSCGGHTGQGVNSQRKGRSNVGAQNAAKVVSGLPTKNLLGIPWRVAFALQDDGWILRNAIIWNKPNAMPESVTDRLSGRYEMVFMFSKAQRYWFDLDPIREPLAYAPGPDLPAIADDPIRYAPGVKGQTGRAITGRRRTFTDNGGRNPGDVWNINTQPFSAAHFAVMPSQLAQRCIVAGCKPGGTVLDPFSGSGTTGLAAQRTGRRYIGIDLNAEYLDLSLKTRLHDAALDFEETADV
jgi:DNA modification methylase